MLLPIPLGRLVSVWRSGAYDDQFQFHEGESPIMKIGLFTLAFFLLAASSGANGQSERDYPRKSVRILVSFSPGATVDITTRLASKFLQERLKQPFIVENRPGAGGLIGAQELARATPDGYTLLACANNTFYAHLTTKNVNFDWRKDLTPIARMVGGGLMLSVHASVPVRTLAEFVTYAKANPGKLNLADAGTLNPVTEEIKSMLGINLTSITYKGGAPAFQALMTGESQVQVLGLYQAIALEEQGKGRALVYTSIPRHPKMPHVPTLSESGFPGYTGGFWTGFVAPGGTPTGIVRTLNLAINALNKDPEMVKFYEKNGYDTYDDTPAQMQATIENEVQRFTKVFANLGVMPQ